MSYGSRSVYQTVFGGSLPNTEAVVNKQGVLTYPQLAEHIADAAAHLAASGVRPGSRIGLQVGNGADFAVAFHAIAKLGAVVVPIGVGVSKEDRAEMLQLADADRLLTREDIRPLRKPRGGLLSPEPLISPEQLACLPFSSGTTGTPKAVQLTHRSLSANIEQFADVLPLGAGETCLSVLPFTHIYGLTAQLNVPLALRARIVAQDFSRQSFFKSHADYDVSLAFIAPPLAKLYAEDPLVSSTNLSALKTVISGAAPLNVDIAKVAQERISARIIQGFGLTEAAPVTHLAWKDNLPLDTIGHLLPGTEAKVIDTESGLGSEIGELWVRGPQVMSGYLGDDQATSTVLIDGWLKTGDLVQRRSDDSFVVIDRLKDLIKSKGFQVSPVKLERILLEHPRVHDVAVIRGYGADGEEQPVACVVAEAPAEELLGFVKDRVTAYERIRAVRFVESIPRSAAGKILRRQLVRDQRS